MNRGKLKLYTSPYPNIDLYVDTIKSTLTILNSELQFDFALECASRVLSIWCKAFPSDVIMENALNAARRIRLQEGSPELMNFKKEVRLLVDRTSELYDQSEGMTDLVDASEWGKCLYQAENAASSVSHLLGAAITPSRLASNVAWTAAGAWCASLFSQNELELQKSSLLEKQINRSKI